MSVRAYNTEPKRGQEESMATDCKSENPIEAGVPQEQNGSGGESASLMESVLYEVKKVIVGQDALLERLLVALLARGHILVEGVPGLAKTLAIKSLAEST